MKIVPVVGNRHRPFKFPVVVSPAEELKGTTQSAHATVVRLRARGEQVSLVSEARQWTSVHCHGARHPRLNASRPKSTSMIFPQSWFFHKIFSQLRLMHIHDRRTRIMFLLRFTNFLELGMMNCNCTILVNGTNNFPVVLRIFVILKRVM
jgi:hypothetical protein